MIGLLIIVILLIPAFFVGTLLVFSLLPGKNPEKDMIQAIMINSIFFAIAVVSCLLFFLR